MRGCGEMDLRNDGYHEWTSFRYRPRAKEAGQNPYFAGSRPIRIAATMAGTKSLVSPGS